MFVLQERYEIAPLTKNVKIALVNEHDFPSAIQKVKNMLNERDNVKRNVNRVEFQEPDKELFGVELLSFSIFDVETDIRISYGYITNTIATII